MSSTFCKPASILGVETHGHRADKVGNAPRSPLWPWTCYCSLDSPFPQLGYGGKPTQGDSLDSNSTVTCLCLVQGAAWPAARSPQDFWLCVDYLVSAPHPLCPVFWTTPFPSKQREKDGRKPVSAADCISGCSAFILNRATRFRSYNSTVPPLTSEKLLWQDNSAEILPTPKPRLSMALCPLNSTPLYQRIPSNNSSHGGFLAWFYFSYFML